MPDPECRETTALFVESEWRRFVIPITKTPSPMGPDQERVRLFLPPVQSESRGGDRDTTRRALGIIAVGLLLSNYRLAARRARRPRTRREPMRIYAVPRV